MNALAEAAMEKTPGSRPDMGWRRAALRPALGREEDWDDPGLHAQVWGLADRLLYDLFDARAVAEEFETGWQAARFDLARWDGRSLRPGEAAGTEPVAAGSLSDAKRVRDLPPGLYRLSLEVPRRGDLRPLRGVAWVPLWPWDAQRYQTWGYDRAHWRQVLTNNQPRHRTLPSLVFAGGLTLHPGPGGYTQDFGIVATSRAELPAGTYLLRVTSEDAVRVSVDDRRVAGSWAVRAASTDTGTIELKGGVHELRVEYNNGSGEFHLRLEIEPVAPGTAAPVAPDAELDYLAGKIARQPTDSGAWAGRGQLLARHRRFDEARKHLDRAIELGAGDVNAWHAAAALRLQAGDDEGYREYCRKMLERFKDSKDRWVCHRVAEACVIAPGAISGKDLDAASGLIDRALRDDAPEMEWRHRAYMELTRGIADYRRGDYAAAARLLRRAIERPMSNEMPAVNSFFLAMTQHRLGEQSEAQSLYRQGVEAVEDIVGDELATPAKGVLGTGGTGWTMWVHAHAARREAEALIQAPSGSNASSQPAAASTKVEVD